MHVYIGSLTVIGLFLFQCIGLWPKVIVGTPPYTGTYYIYVNLVFICCVHVAMHTLLVHITHCRKPLPTGGHTTYTLTLFPYVTCTCPAHVVFIYIRQMHALVGKREPVPWTKCGLEKLVF